MTLAFIVGAPGSGATNVSEFAAALGANVDVAPAPALHMESRLVMNGVRPASMQALRVLDKRLHPKAEDTSRIFVEQNFTYGPFLHLLAERYSAKIIYVIRDGRDFVSSWMSWNQRNSGAAYREHALRQGGTPAAQRNSLDLALKANLNDTAHPRPRAGQLDPLDWIRTTWIHKFSYMWSAQNAWHLNSFHATDHDARVIVRTGQSGARSAAAVADALGLAVDDQFWGTHFPQGGNSIADHVHHIPDDQYMPEWTGEQEHDFNSVAQPMMRALGYAPHIRRRPEPQSFGSIWRAPAADRDWYTWMHDSRPESHRFLCDWFAKEARDSESFLEVGCGAGVFFPQWIIDKFPEATYTGVDLSATAVALARRHSRFSGKDFESIPVSELLGSERFDVVFSQATVDNVPDIDAFVHDMIRLSRRWVVFSCSRETIETSDHEYEYVDAAGYFSNRVSIPALNQLMTSFPECVWRLVRIRAKVSGVDEAHIIIRKMTGADAL
ncbi:MAG: methyltransferase domain-containing protein [Actinobacteria bacterium]|uniref:Unannotated protein n=1 Tax=freshwater metagenome TaxID=449393 RepID=A0A6J7L1Q9_9ZZZZ|nr:methyltransferase domain-containing protein [Actinomycetota bacterium]